jgi:hypothetical protein
MRSWPVLIAVAAASMSLAGISRAADITIKETGSGLTTVDVPAGKTQTLFFDVIMSLVAGENVDTYAVSVEWDGAAIVGGTDPFLKDVVGTPFLFPGFPIPLGPLGTTQSTSGVRGTFDSFGGVNFPVVPHGTLTATIATLSVTILAGTVAGDATSITPFFGPPDGLASGGPLIPTTVNGATINIIPPVPVPALSATGMVLLGLALVGSAALTFRR